MVIYKYWFINIGKFFTVAIYKFRKTFFSGVSFDSSQVKKNDIFFAIKGQKFNGENHIQEAIKYGAKVIVCSKNCKYKNKNYHYLQEHHFTSKLLFIQFSNLISFSKDITSSSFPLSD